jgi:transposase
VERVQLHMRGPDQQQSHIFSYISPEQRVRKDHPLRAIRAMVDEVLTELSPEFTKMYAKVGRPSIPPEQLLRALLLQLLYSVRKTSRRSCHLRMASSSSVVCRSGTRTQL